MALGHDKIRKMAMAYTEAWNSGSTRAVADFYAEDGRITINRGTPWIGHERVAEMAAGFYADIPDLKLVCDDIRIAGDHVAYFWTFTGTHAASKKQVRVCGWEEWDLDQDYKVRASLGWFDADDYARQTSR